MFKVFSFFVVLCSSSFLCAYQLEDQCNFGNEKHRYHFPDDAKKRHVFKKYIDFSKVYFRDSHFRFYNSSGKMIVLTSIRADAGGIFYYEKDSVVKK